MAKGRNIAAESIADFLEAAYIHQHSGLLRAEYSQNGQLEEGEVYILAGQPIYARIGKVTGPEALNLLLRWRHILFSFNTDMPRPPANIGSSFKITESVKSLPLSALPSTSTRNLAGGQDERRLPSFIARNRYRLFSNSAAPRKVDLKQDIHALYLSRKQRTIYFLVDGHRTVSDLARTTSKTLSEIEIVLQELQDMHLISM